MIRVDLSGVQATQRLRDDQAALDGVDDAAGPATVAARGAEGWLGLRDQLWGAQNGKCAYCEGLLQERSHEVDHIRPQSPGMYWWLAFAVPNLLLACRTCNNAKRDDFELQPGVVKLAPRQVPWHVDEPAMLVDPTQEDPEEHVTYVFRGGRWRIAAANGSDRGTWMIEHLELDRMSFTRDANRLIRLVVHPLVIRLRNAQHTRNHDEIRAAIAALVGLTAPDQPWSQLMRIAVQAVRSGTYPGPPLKSTNPYPRRRRRR